VGRPRKISASSIARAAGISQQAVSKNPHLKHAADGSIDAGASIEALEKIEDAQARKERALADLRELELAERRGELVSLAEVNEQAFSTARSVRDAMLAIPDRTAAILAAESDPVKLHNALTVEIRKALGTTSTELSDLVRSGIDAGSTAPGVGVGGQTPETPPAGGG
jgi:hypothetical protein